MCANCRAFISTGDRVCPYCNTEVAPRVVRRASSEVFGGAIPHTRFLTILILLINTGLYIATVVANMRQGASAAADLDLRVLYDFGAKYAPAIAGGQWWRLITAGFLHGGLLHILMNMWVLFDLGAQVEEFYGGARFLLIYLISNITGFTASLYLLPSPSIGASAALFGLIGAMIAMGVRERGSRGSAIRSFYMRWAIYGLVLSLIPGTDWAAHLGGIAGGFIVGFIVGLPSYSETIERVCQIGAGVMVGITGLAFYDMVVNLLSLQ